MWCLIGRVVTVEEVSQFDDERFFCGRRAGNERVNRGVSQTLRNLQIEIVARLFGPGVHAKVRVAHRVDREKVRYARAYILPVYGRAYRPRASLHTLCQCFAPILER